MKNICIAYLTNNKINYKNIINIKMSYLEALKKNIDKKIIIKSSNNQQIYTNYKKYNSKQKKKKLLGEDKIFCCNNQLTAIKNEHVQCLNNLLYENNIDKECYQIENSFGDTLYYNSIEYAFMTKKYKIIKYFHEKNLIKDDLYLIDDIKHCYLLEKYVNSDLFELLKKYGSKEYPEFPPYDFNLLRDYEILAITDISLVKLLYEKYNKTDGITIKDIVRSGRLDILEYAISMNFKFDKKEILDFIDLYLQKIKYENDLYISGCNSFNHDPNYIGYSTLKNIEICKNYIIKL